MDQEMGHFSWKGAIHTTGYCALPLTVWHGINIVASMIAH